MISVRVFETPDEVAREAAHAVALALEPAGGSLVLAGGTTPRRCYEVLAGMDLPWGRITVLFGDERCVPPSHRDSNYLMARRSLLDAVSPASVHRMPGELGPHEAAYRYGQVVEHLMPLDVVLLGIGPDGHTASLFPGHPALEAGGWVVGVEGAPKPPPERVTLTLHALRQSKAVMVLVTGADKAEAVAKAREGLVPAGMIDGAVWFVDRAAAGSAA